MIDEIIRSTVDKHIKENMAHLLMPGAMLASVTAASPADSYDYKDMTIEGCDKCGPFDAKITGKWYEYNLKILTKDGQVDANYPEIPSVKSKHQIPDGGIAAVVMLYGELRPYIIGEAR